jgi:hypothetical protein
MSTCLDKDKQGKIVEIIVDDSQEIYITLDGYDFYFIKNSEKTFLASVAASIISCFQDYSEPINNTTGYMLYEDDIWDLTKNYIVSSIDLSIKRYRIILKSASGSVTEIAASYFVLIDSELEYLESSTIVDLDVPLASLSGITAILYCPSVEIIGS